MIDIAKKEHLNSSELPEPAPAGKAVRPPLPGTPAALAAKQRLEASQATADALVRLVREHYPDFVLKHD